MFDLSGKTALVTGSSRGIGAAIAWALAENGADIILHGRRKSDALDDMQQKIHALGRRCWAITADTSDPAQIEALFGQIREEAGTLHILVNNAAILTRAPFLELTLREWDAVMETNARGYFLCMQYAARQMVRDQIPGRIINISSISQYEAAAGRTHYCASKGAIGMLSRSSALELAPYRITVNELLPGSIHTDFNNDVLSDPVYYENCRKGIPLGRLGVPADLGAAVVFLASEEAAYVTGAEIRVDGGKLL